MGIWDWHWGSGLGNEIGDHITIGDWIGYWD